MLTFALFLHSHIAIAKKKGIKGFPSKSINGYHRYWDGDFHKFT